MKLGELLDVLAARGSTLAVDGDRLRHCGPRFADGDPTRRALTTFHDELVFLVTERRLCVCCPQMLAEGDRIVCPEHRRQLDTMLMIATGREGQTS